MATTQTDNVLHSVERVFAVAYLSLHEEFLAKLRSNRQGNVAIDEVLAAVGAGDEQSISAETIKSAILSSQILLLNEDGVTIRRKHPMQRITIPDTQRHTGT